MKKEFNVERLDHFGRGIGTFNNKVVFIENALDNEEIEAEVYDDEKKVLNGVTTKILRPSQYRKEAECPYYDLCGGCNIMHMTYPKQLDFKLNKVREILSKFANIDRDVIKKIIPSSEFNYRNKITLKVKEKVGLYKRKTYELVLIDKCIISSPKVNTIIEHINKLKLDKIEEIIIRNTSKEESMVIFKVTENINKENYHKSLKEVTDNLVIIKDGISNIVFGKGYITEKIGTYYFNISPLSFFQVNTNSAEKLYNLIKEYADLNGNENILDLYCGTGTIGIYLSDQAKMITGIEINSEAVKCAIDNKELNNINNIEFICKDVSKVIDEYKDIDLVIVDPPRAGLNKKAIDNIIKISPKKLIYVSCNPSTLSRDINILKNNYAVEEITLVDMFPNTYHVESVCLLKL